MPGPAGLASFLLPQRPMPSALSLGSQIEVTIDALTYGHGHGLARADGLVIFVPNTAPGDVANVEITKLKKRFAEAKLIEVISPGASRTEAPCAVFGECGGCQWQHVEYEEQVRQKQSILEQTFLKAKLSPEMFLPFVPSDSPWSYRNRIQLQFHDGRFGFRGKGSHKMVATESCLIADDALIQGAQSLVERGARGRHELFLRPNGSVGTLSSDEQSEESFFAQVNEAMNQKLLQIVTAQTSENAQVIFDLYGGSGNFAFPVALKAPEAKVFCVDANSTNSENGAAKAKAEGIRNIEFHAMPTHRFLRKKAKNLEPDLIILDPPRAGLDEQTRSLLVDSPAKRLIYISCDPMTASRDITHLCASGWRLESVQGLDMFPQTFHIESISLLSK